MTKTISLAPTVWAADFSPYPDAVLHLMGPMEVVPLAKSDLRLLAGKDGAISPDTQELLALTLPQFAASGARKDLVQCSCQAGPAPMRPIFTADHALTTLRMRNYRVSLLAAQPISQAIA
ncbi:MAG: hypothetical protein MUD11_06170 [Rhodobacteraceae bacterium]|nr:hypothetical protein [Paracoccaceae bacterium]